ncbi:MAG: VacJ family lipoprotein [Rhodospirillaceae bacterium]|nr:VacJ family lipoprotein [Rhodospirillaceae bacterium]
MFKMIRSIKPITMAALLLSFVSMPVFAGSDTPATDGAPQEVDDPFESINRVTSGFNRFFRKAVADPLVSGYEAVTPEPVQKAISSIASNLTEPVTAVSSLLQGDTDNAGRATSRFIMNTTLGIAGMNDAAGEMGMEQRREDLGQAAGAQGVGGGAHIVLPFFGPSNTRDAAGDILTSVVNPFYLATSSANAATGYADNREEIDSLTGNAIDPYIVERDAYEQNRLYQVNNGEASLSDIPDFEDQDKAAAQ